jgi:uncharacterized protein YggE
MPPSSITVPLPPRPAVWLAIGLAGGLLVAAIASPAFAPRPIAGADPTTPPEHTISVSGTGKVVVSPDIADLRLGVSVTKPKVKAARDAAAQQMTSVIAALKKLGIADQDIKTTNLSLQPVYTYPTNGGTPKLTGYNLTNTVAVTIRDLDKVGDAIDDSIAAGATTMDGVTFRVEDPAKAEEQARKEAMTQAKAKAETLASSAGIRITGVSSITETSAPIVYPVPYYGEAVGGAARDVSTPVETGTNEISVSVAVVYLID